MLRPAVSADIPRIFEICNDVSENRLSDPGAVSEGDAVWLLEHGPIWVWQEEGRAIDGFAAGDPRDGSIWALFVAPGEEGRGIGRALLKAACDSLRDAGHRRAVLSTEPGSRAERHYRSHGWSAAGHNAKGELVLQKPL